MQSDDKYFSVKYYGTANPLVITLPPNERSGGAQYVEVELGAFFWNTPWRNFGTVANNDLSIVKCVIPGLSSGNYDINGANTNIAVIIAPSGRPVTNISGSGQGYELFTYSPGRPDLYLCPPTPQLIIWFYDKNNNPIDFTKDWSGSTDPHPYYASFNISM